MRLLWWLELLLLLWQFQSQWVTGGYERTICLLWLFKHCNSSHCVCEAVYVFPPLQPFNEHVHTEKQAPCYRDATISQLSTNTKIKKEKKVWIPPGSRWRGRALRSRRGRTAGLPAPPSPPGAPGCDGTTAGWPEGGDVKKSNGTTMTTTATQIFWHLKFLNS